MKNSFNIEGLLNNHGKDDDDDDEAKPSECGQITDK